MRILVTGGAGFIGSHVCESLLDRGDEIICVDNFNDFYNPEEKEHNLLECKNNPKFSLHKMDITDEDSMKGLFSNVDAVVHLAAWAGVRPSLERPLVYVNNNIQGTAVVLECARKAGVKRFIFGSSSSVYGERKEVPFKETDEVNHPISPYAATKKAGELLCYTYHHTTGMKMTCLRFFTVYGPRNRPDLAIRKFSKYIREGKEITLFDGGELERDFTNVKDIVRGILSAIDNPFDYEIINLGNSNPVKVNDLVALLEKYLGKKANVISVPRPPGDVSRTFADVSKAKKLLDWEPNISFEDGIREFVDWFTAKQSD